jgi:4-amino-4-deoxy-L-arabinose transferase-like glycosyltransferase
MLSVLFSVVGIVSVYLIVREFIGERIALLSALIYSLSPTIILYNSFGNYRQVAYPLVALGFYFLMLGTRHQRMKYFLLHGAIIGLATIFYRVTAIFLITSPLLLWLRLRQPKAILRPFIAIIVAGLSASLPVIGVVSFFSSIQWVNRVWGFGGGVNSSSYYLASPSSFLSFAGLASYVDFRSRVAFVVVREWLYMILPSLIGLLTLLGGRKLTRSRFMGSSLCCLLVLITADVSRGLYLGPRGNWGTYEVLPAYDFLNTALLWLGVSLVLAIAFSVEVKGFRTEVRDFMVFWLATILAALSLFLFVHVFYFIALAAVLSILSAFGLVTLARIARSKPGEPDHNLRVLGTILFIVLICSVTISSLSMYGTTIGERDVTQAQAQMIGEYIRERTGPHDEILTGNLIYTVTSQRNNALNISNPYIYLRGLDDPFPGNPYGSTPSVTELAKYLSTGRVKYVIMDPQLAAIADQHSNLRESLSMFWFDNVFFGVSIYRYV